MKMMYTENDIIRENGHIRTKDRRYYLDEDREDFCYWRKVEKVDGEKLTVGMFLGNMRDYLFRSQSNAELADMLNSLK